MDFKKKVKILRKSTKLIWKTIKMDSSNDLSYSMQKLFRIKTKDEPKKLDQTFTKINAGCKIRNANVFVRLRKWQCKEESHSSKVQTTLIDRTLFKKCLKEKEKKL